MEMTWEIVADEQFDRVAYLSSFFGQTSRLPVPGGWIYKTVYWSNVRDEVYAFQVFVPDAASTAGRE